MEKRTKVILIGCGPHAKRVYLPALKNLDKAGKVELKLVVDLFDQKDVVEELLKQQEIVCETFFCNTFTSQVLPEKIGLFLAEFCRLQEISGVIIATEPLCHRAYAEWALVHGLNILMDKPISTQSNCVSMLDKAIAIKEDFDYLYDLYKNNFINNIFVINTQRRFHPGFNFVLEKIKSMSELTNCPVTNINAYHCDGQWRFPSEIISQDYHPYNSGYGKGSHSGYHIFDIIYKFYNSSIREGKRADKIEIISSFIQPDGFIKQIAENDYKLIFGDDLYSAVQEWNDEELLEKTKNYGEIDLSAIVTLKKDNVAVANLNITLLHNGFARRTWLTPGLDLYKGNGRVKHEHYSIQQGPFQNIQIHSYQSKDKHNNVEELEYWQGGNDHFDVVIYTNPLFCAEEQSMQTYSMQDILKEYNMDVDDMLVTEKVKHTIVDKFIAYLNGELLFEQVESQIYDHQLSVKIMSGIYQSHILRQRNENCTVNYPFDYS